MSTNPFAGNAFAEDEDKEVPTTIEEEEECGAEEETVAHDDYNDPLEEGEGYEAEEQEGDDDQHEADDGTAYNAEGEEEGGKIIAVNGDDAQEEAVVQAQDAVEECVTNATEEYSAEMFISIQAELAETLSANVALTNSHSIVTAKLESTEKELQLVKDALSQLQQLMAASAAAAAAAACEQTASTASTPAVVEANIPSFDAVELALELEVTDRKLIKAAHDAEASSLLASKWEEEAKRYAGMYHEVVGGRYVPLLSDHGAAIIQAGGEEGSIGTKVIAYFADLLRGTITPPIADGDSTFSKPQREILLDYILACGYELQFMMMRTHINDINLRRRTSELEVATTKGMIGEKRVRCEDTLASPNPTTTSVTTTNNVAASVKQGLLEELIQELSSSGGTATTTKWDLSKTQLTPATTATINALRAHVTKFDQLERTVQTQEKMLDCARSISANPLFELAWDREINNNTAAAATSNDNINAEELILLKGRNKLLTGACRMYYRRSQQLLLELANKNSTASSTMGVCKGHVGG
jgi:hypothetical protein